MNNVNKANGQPGDVTLQTLSFISLVELEKDVFRGGVLVTDTHGKPLEFRCTSAIKPTLVQKALYGEILKQYMAVDLTARPLLSALQSKYDAILASEECFMELRKVISRPLFVVAKQNAMPPSCEAGEKLTRSEILTSPSGKFGPIILLCHREHPDDLAQALPSLRILFSRFDLSEPFTRIHNALRLLHEMGAVSND